MNLPLVVVVVVVVVDILLASIRVAFASVLASYLHTSSLHTCIHPLALGQADKQHNDGDGGTFKRPRYMAAYAVSRAEQAGQRGGPRTGRLPGCHHPTAGRAGKEVQAEEDGRLHGRRLEVETGAAGTLNQDVAVSDHR